MLNTRKIAVEIGESKFGFTYFVNNKKSPNNVEASFNKKLISYLKHKFFAGSSCATYFPSLSKNINRVPLADTGPVRDGVSVSYLNNTPFGHSLICKGLPSIFVALSLSKLATILSSTKIPLTYVLYKPQLVKSVNINTINIFFIRHLQSKFQFLITLVILTLFVNSFSNKVYALGEPGSIVYDSTNAITLTNQLTQLEQSLKYYKSIAESIGKGDINPEVVDFLVTTANRCGFKPIELPNIKLPSLPKICGNEDKALNISITWYQNNIFTTNADTPEILKRKNITRNQTREQMNVAIAGFSGMMIKNSASSSEIIGKLNDAISKCNTQICISKLQAQIEVQKLAMDQQKMTLEAMQANRETLR